MSDGPKPNLRRGRKTARSVLETMMRELGKHDWPSDKTWADACRIVGWPVPPPLPVSDARVSVLEAAVEPSRSFTMTGLWATLTPEQQKRVLAEKHDDSGPMTALPEGWVRNPDGSVTPPSITCRKCGQTGVVFICDAEGCPVNGGAAHG